MSVQFSFEPAFLAVMLIIPIGFIIVVWIALRKYFETRQVGFLSIALAFLLVQAFAPIASFGPFEMFMFTIWLFTGLLVLFFGLIAYGLWKISSGPPKSPQLPAAEKLSLIRQLSLLAGTTTITAVFSSWATYGYSFRTSTGNYGGGGVFTLLDTFRLPNTVAMAELEQINLNILVIASTLAAVLLLVAGLGCILRDAKWSVLSIAGLTAFFFAYVGSPGANIMIATGSSAGGSGATGWQMALSLGPVLGILGAAIGLAALVLHVQRGVGARINHA